ncbi:MAG: GAF domain-containing protein, partial [Burkholderiales bacterium]|nr:GAF domain-containing protein [Burkholderiales bacterium]
ATLFRHVNELLDARCFLVFMLQEDILTMAFSRENGVAVDFPPLTLDHPQSHFARVARTRKEILVHLEAEHDDPNHVLGTLDTHSLLFAPLLVGDRLLGVMSIQTPSLYAYGERESSIFLTLCAYGAIALDNAAAYAQAERAQAQADQALSHLQ